MTYAVLLNGPPRCGKSHAGRIIAQSLSCRVHVDAFARRLKDQVHAIYGMGVEHNAFEGTIKDEPSPLFLGLSPRAAYIAFAERYFRAVHGQDVYGRLLLQAVVGRPELLVVTDAGFPEEAQAVIESRGPKHCLLVRIARRHCDWSKDSRGYLQLPCSSVDIENRGDRAFEAEVVDAVRALLPQGLR